ncbi:MAG: hypothetical protein E7548_03480 [Ruminococcaceae bacterium]|nr:hypothetical protein [Oscillospiraceae bacterium]
MFVCKNCYTSFVAPKTEIERHGKTEPPYEEFHCCPNCESRSFYETAGGYCRSCGRKIAAGKEYCNETCRKQGEALWAKQRAAREAQKNDPMQVLIRKTEEYNKKHGTRLSYGQFTAYLEAGVISINDI